MFSQIDNIVFADRCEVYQIGDSQRFVYPIFKNGYSSIERTRNIQGWRTLINQQISRCGEIEVVLREPVSRFASGVNTYLQKVQQENLDLDPSTVRWFVANHLFLNRHYAPQFSWMCNLARFLDPNTKIKYLDMSAIHTMTDLHRKPPGVEPITEEISRWAGTIPNTEMYIRLDRALVQCVGEYLTWSETKLRIQEFDRDAYQYVTKLTKQISNVL